MGSRESSHPINVALSGKTRWLAIATGCFTAVAGSLGFTWGFAIVPGFLIVGAILQPRLPRTGRILMCGGALSLSVWVLCFGIFILPEDPSPFFHRPGALAFSLASALLVALCDVALVKEEVSLRRPQIEQKKDRGPISKQTRWLVGITGCLTAVSFAMAQGLGLLSGFLIVGALLAGRFPRSGRNLIWFGAGIVSLTELPFGVTLLLLSTHGGQDPRVTAAAAASVLLILWCDGALVTSAFEAGRARHAEKPK